MPIDTLSNVKARLGITSSSDDTLLGLLQDSADAFISNSCQRDFTGGTFTEYHPGNSEFVIVKNYPITTVTSVKVDASHGFSAETLMSSDQYVVHSDRGVIQSLFGPFLPKRIQGLVNSNIQIWTRGPRTVQVVYTSSTTVPKDIQEAYARLIGAWYRTVKTEVAANFQEVRQQKFGDTFVIYGTPGNGAIPIEVERLLAAYRVPNL
jgi:hypothetical protein